MALINLRMKYFFPSTVSIPQLYRRVINCVKANRNSLETCRWSRENKIPLHPFLRYGFANTYFVAEHFIVFALTPRRECGKNTSLKLPSGWTDNSLKHANEFLLLFFLPTRGWWQNKGHSEFSRNSWAFFVYTQLEFEFVWIYLREKGVSFSPIPRLYRLCSLLIYAESNNKLCNIMSMHKWNKSWSKFLGKIT